MILIDSNILIDALEPESLHHGWSLDRLTNSLRRGAFINTIVASEISPRFLTLEDLAITLESLAIPVRDLTLSAAWLAGRAYLTWIRNGGRRGTILPDILIGAHASSENASVLTRDPRRFRTYFPELELITPETHDD